MDHRTTRAALLLPALLGAALLMGGCAGADLSEAAATPAAASSEPSADGAPSHAVARRGELRDTLLLTGELRAAQAVDLIVPRTPRWRLQLRWMVDDGTAVEAGDRVVEFDSTEFTSDLEEKKLSLREQENELERLRAEGEVTVAERQLAIEQKEVALAKARLEADVPRELLAERDYEDAQLALRRAELELAKAEEELESARAEQQAELAVKRIEIDKARREIEAAERALEAVTLTAPEAGIFVVEEHRWEGRKIQEGDMVFAGMTVARLPDLTTMEVDARLSDVDDGRVRPGMEATCTLDAYPEQSYPCRVTSVAPVARESDRSSLLRFFDVGLELLEDDPQRMRPGMSVKVEVVGRSLPDVLLAPRRALDERAEPPRARLRDGGVVEVELGPCNAHDCVVLDGLTEGQELAG